MGSFEDSLTFALGAGELFDINSSSEYIETTIGKSSGKGSSHICVLKECKFESILLRKLKVFYLCFLAKCIDFYTKLKVHNLDAKPEDQKPIDPRLEAVVDRMLLRCFEDGQFKQALGIALETRRMDVFEKAILSSVSLLL